MLRASRVNEAPFEASLEDWGKQDKPHFKLFGRASRMAFGKPESDQEFGFRWFPGLCGREGD
jgi:hypothetical protein